MLPVPLTLYLQTVTALYNHYVVLRKSNIVTAHLILYHFLTPRPPPRHAASISLANLKPTERRRAPLIGTRYVVRHKARIAVHTPRRIMTLTGSILAGRPHICVRR